MQRKHLATSLFLSYVGLVGVAGFWSLGQWSASAPVAHAEVKGANTSLLTETPVLSDYPSVDQSLARTIQAGSFVLYNVESGQTILSSQPDEPVPIASTTKLMTAYVISRIGDPTDLATVSKEAASQPAESSLMGLHAKESISVEDLLYGALLVSGNDAAYTLGEYGGGLLLNNPAATPDEKVARFVEEMNATARRLQMNDTQYHDSIGFNDEGHSSALDLAKLTAKVIEVPELRKIVGTANQTVYGNDGFYKYELRNSNRLVTEYQYLGSIGGKTGFTNLAGHCLVSAAARDGKTFVAVILHTRSETNDASAIEARKLLDIGFTQVRWR